MVTIAIGFFLVVVCISGLVLVGVAALWLWERGQRGKEPGQQ
jgi:hypothetical protein